KLPVVISENPAKSPAVSAAVPTPTAEGAPAELLYITAAREGYASGDLVLRIPKLAVAVPVLDGVDAATLLEGVGLYDYAQLPDERHYHRQYALLLSGHPLPWGLPLSHGSEPYLSVCV
ncbi:MAG: hypothetical protein RRY64_10545, partial [Oscillospiraceae bacterium]